MELTTLREEARDLLDETVALRRTLHRWPELGNDLPITRDQRVHPVKHPRHVLGGLMVHMTGVLGLVHAYYVLDLRHRDGWIGYGVRIHSAKFAALAPPGEPLILEGRMTQARRGSKRILARYELVFTQRGKTVYQGEQSAMWIRVEEGEAISL